MVHYLSADRAERFHYWYGLVLLVGMFPFLILLGVGLMGVIDDPAEARPWIFLVSILAMAGTAGFLWSEFDSVSGHEPPRLGCRNLWFATAFLHVGGTLAAVAFGWSVGGILGVVLLGPILVLPLLAGAWPSIAALRDEWMHEYHCTDFDGRAVWEPIFLTDDSPDLEEEDEALSREPEIAEAPAPPPGPPAPPRSRSDN